MKYRPDIAYHVVAHEHVPLRNGGMVVQAFDAKIKERKIDEIPQLFTYQTKERIISQEVIETKN